MAPSVQQSPWPCTLPCPVGCSAPHRWMTSWTHGHLAGHGHVLLRENLPKCTRLQGGRATSPTPGAVPRRANVQRPAISVWRLVLMASQGPAAISIRRLVLMPMASEHPASSVPRLVLKTARVHKCRRPNGLPRGQHSRSTGGDLRNVQCAWRLT